MKGNFDVTLRVRRRGLVLPRVADETHSVHQRGAITCIVNVKHRVNRIRELGLVNGYSIYDPRQAYEFEIVNRVTSLVGSLPVLEFLA